MNNIVTIDGPSGAGKTSTAQLVAERLGLTYIPSGKLFRIVAFLAREKHIDIHDKNRLADLLDQRKLDMQASGRILYAGADISYQLTEADIGSMSTILAQDKRIRTQLLELQRKIGANGCVIEGRSTAIEVFPEAETKIWLTADAETRIDRKKYAEGEGSAGAVLTRDEIDKERRLAPMQKAKAAITIDTTDMSLQQVAAAIVRCYEYRQSIS